MEVKKKENYLKNEINNNLKKEKITDDKVFGNKIMEAINKEYDDKNIMNMHKFSLIIVLIIIICSILFLYFEINSYSNFITILSILKKIISIKYCNKIGVYFIRELTLLNIVDTGIKGGQYIMIPSSNRTEYLALVKKNILELFIESQSSMSEFIGTSLSISESSNIYLTQTNLITKLSNSNLQSSLVKNNIIITLVQLNSAFYNLANSNVPVEQNHPDLFNFIYNSLNNYGLAINILIQTYIKELDLKCKSYQTYFQILLIIYFVIFILAYIICLFLLSKVAQRKKSYLNIFLNINYDFITYSINKCEQFINKFKLSEETKIQEEEIEDSNDEKASLIQSKSNFKDLNITLKRKTLYITNNQNKKKFKCSNDLIFKIIFGIFLLLIYIYYCVYGFYYFIKLKKNVYYISNFYYHLQHHQLNIIEYFNIYREYLFDNSSIIFNSTIYENLIQKEKIIYGNWTDNINNLTFFTKTLIDDKDTRLKLNRSLCSFNLTDFYKNYEVCIKEVDNNFNEDINSFSNNFIDEIRIKKNIINFLLEKDAIKGNLTEYKTETWYNKYYDLLKNETRYNTTIKIRFRLELFNDEYFHSMCNRFFINIILPYINQNRKIIFDYLIIEGKHNTYYLIFALFIIINLALYFFIGFL